MTKAIERPCPHAGKGGPCWGRVLLVDEAHTESQYVEYWACEGHVEVARYGFEDRYRPEPRWTTATPTVPGYYWWRRRKGIAASVVLVTGTSMVFEHGGGYSTRLAKMGGEWYGPLTAPED